MRQSLLVKKRNKAVNKWYRQDANESSVIEEIEKIEKALVIALPKELEDYTVQIESKEMDDLLVNEKKRLVLQAQLAALDDEDNKIRRDKKEKIELFKQNQSQVETALAKKRAILQTELTQVRSNKEDTVLDVQEIEQEMDDEQVRLKQEEDMAINNNIRVVFGSITVSVDPSSSSSSIAKFKANECARINPAALRDHLRLHTLSDCSKLNYSLLFTILEGLRDKGYGENDEFVRRGLEQIASFDLLWRYIEGEGDTVKLFINDDRISRGEVVLKLALYLDVKFDCTVDSKGRVIRYAEPDDDVHATRLSSIPDDIRERLQQRSTKG